MDHKNVGKRLLGLYLLLSGVGISEIGLKTMGDINFWDIHGRAGRSSSKDLVYAPCIRDPMILDSTLQQSAELVDMFLCLSPRIDGDGPTEGLDCCLVLEGGTCTAEKCGGTMDVCGSHSAMFDVSLSRKVKEYSMNKNFRGKSVWLYSRA